MVGWLDDWVKCGRWTLGLFLIMILILIIIPQLIKSTSRIKIRIMRDCPLRPQSSFRPLNAEFAENAEKRKNDSAIINFAHGTHGITRKK